MTEAEALPRSLDELRAALRVQGAKPVHERRLLQAWLGGEPLTGTALADDPRLPKGLRSALPGIAALLGRVGRVATAELGRDGAARLLVVLADGQSVEAVLLPRDALCVSTQVGCAVGCRFCITGTQGLARHLGSAEIVAQVALARARRPVRKVVFMGMGEPAHNLDAVLDAIECLGREGAIGHKNLVLSTVGDPRLFDRLMALPAEAVRPALALSLHTTSAVLRRELLPHAPRLDPAELVERSEAYARATGYPLQVQWTLLAGINDGDDEVERIVGLFAGRHAVLNFIAWNPDPGLPYARPAPERIFTLTRALNARGILTKLRDSVGLEVDAACGQLRSRLMPATIRTATPDP